MFVNQSFSKCVDNKPLEMQKKTEILADQFENTSKRSRRQRNDNPNKATTDNHKHCNNNEKEPWLNLKDIQRAISQLK